MSIRGNPKRCPKPCPSVSFNENPIVISCLKTNETISCNEKIQIVDSQEVSEVESKDLVESDIYPFESMYGEMDEDNFQRMMEGNDQIHAPSFNDKGFLNED